MFDTVAGLPMHPLIVHATVAVVPTAALVVGLAGVWPTFRARTGALALVGQGFEEASWAWVGVGVTVIGLGCIAPMT
jgi:uncharacterized membrane protein